MVLVGGPSLPKMSFPELIKEMKAKPNHFTYASVGVGSQTHLPARMLERAAGVQLLHVPYAGGGQMMRALLGKDVHLMFASATSAATLSQTAGVNVIGIAGPKRLEAFPGVPTLSELG